MCCQGVVQGGQPSLGSYTQMQKAFGGMACMRQHVIQRAQAPAGQTRVPHKAVVAQMVVVVAYQDVVDHALEELCVVRADHTRVAMVAHGLGEVGVRLGARRGLIASQHGQAAHETQAMLHASPSGLRLEQRARLCKLPFRRNPVAVKSANKHDFALTEHAHIERGHLQAKLCRQPQRGTFHTRHIEAVGSAGKLGQPQHTMRIAHRGFRPRPTQRAAVHEYGFEVRGHWQTFLNAVSRLQQVRQIVRDIGTLVWAVMNA